jgi:hypothetical protein
MPLLLTDPALDVRRTLATGPLAPLTRSLLAETQLVSARGVELPTWKARYSRGYARCTACGGPLQFDPWQPHRHTGIRCAHVTVGHEADGWWAVGAQLWAADRAVYAATLALLADDAVAHDVACTVLEAIALHGTLHGVRESVLGPSGPFFSTYLESLWALSIAIAVDLLDADARRRPAMHPAGQRARQVMGLVIDQLLMPSVERIASYDEGASNRQRWNDAAMLAVALVTSDVDRVDRLTDPHHGALASALDGLLEDGSWSEGENYHQFALRGIWYLVQMHRTHQRRLPDRFVDRYALAWSMPLRTVWPDGRLAARRDAQYGVSLQQWRWIEWCELGRVDGPSALLDRTLNELYAASISARETGRLVSTGEAEVNRAPCALSRADLGWKSLLFARPDAPVDCAADSPETFVLRAQGLAILRTVGARGDRMAALDYGHAGGGHGHPDRLALTLADGSVRLLDDLGTGTYADPLLAWYRSALAHTAPIVDGGGQEVGAGRLVGFSADTVASAARATYIEPRRGVQLWRSIRLCGNQLIDVLQWYASDERPARVDLPLSIAAEWSDAHGQSLTWQTASLEEAWQRSSGAAAIDEGTRFAREIERSSIAPGHAATGAINAFTRVSVVASAPLVLWRMQTPGAPAWSASAAAVRCERSLISSYAARGSIVCIWEFDAPPRTWQLQSLQEIVGVDAHHGTERHLVDDAGWLTNSDSGQPWSARWTPTNPTAIPSTPDVPREHAISAVRVPRFSRLLATAPPEATRVRLAEDAFLRADCLWDAYGSPSAEIAIWEDRDFLRMFVELCKVPTVLADPRADNRLDTWPAEAHGDSVMLAAADEAGRVHEWLVTADDSDRGVHLRSRSPAPMTLDASISPTALGTRIDLGWSPAERVVALAVAVVLRRPGSERRDGALVWPARPGWLYGLGDRIGGSIPLVPIQRFHV